MKDKAQGGLSFCGSDSCIPSETVCGYCSGDDLQVTSWFRQESTVVRDRIRVRHLHGSRRYAKLLCTFDVRKADS